MRGVSKQRSRAERYARKFAAAGDKKRMPAPTPDLEHYLDSLPEDVFIVLEGFVERVVAGNPDDPLATGHLLLLQCQLERIRYRRDRGYEDATRLIERFQHVVADLTVAGRIDGQALSMLASALQQAGIAASAELSAAMTRCAEHFTPDVTPNDFTPMLEEVAKQCDNDPYLVVSMLAETGHAMPAQARASMATMQAQSTNAVAREAAVLLLLDPEPAVRQTAAAELQAGVRKLSPDSLRRLIAMRNWRPETERHIVDEIGRAARAKGIDCAPWQNGSAEAILASGLDGSGAQGFLIVSPAGRGKRLSSVLLKNGVRDAWTAPPESQRQTRAALAYAAFETSMIPVSRDYFDRAVRHHLQLGLALEALPPAGLLQVAEAVGGAHWQPELLDWRKVLAAVLAELPAAMLKPHAVREVLRTSAAWAQFGSIAESWFEDDQEVAQLVGRPRGRQQVKMREYVLQSVLVRRREKWAEHFLWTALWLREAPDEKALPWRNFVILAQALADGRDLSEVSLMRDIAARTVTVLAQA
jgi:hypothetical protein